jgi:hypothetical protein
LLSATFFSPFLQKSSIIKKENRRILKAIQKPKVFIKILRFSFLKSLFFQKKRDIFSKGKNVKVFFEEENLRFCQKSKIFEERRGFQNPKDFDKNLSIFAFVLNFFRSSTKCHVFFAALAFAVGCQKPSVLFFESAKNLRFLYRFQKREKRIEGF